METNLWRKKTILCPNCKKQITNINTNINIDTYEFKFLHCEFCNIIFTYILCLYCNNRIYCKKNSTCINDIEINGMNGINIACPYSYCGQVFFLTICPKCKSFEKMPKKNEGELIKCNQEDCGYEYIQLRCPIQGCNDVKYFTKPKNYNNSPNGIIYNHKSKILYQKISCIYCYRPIVYYSDENNIDRYYDSMKVECPYLDCKKKFNRIICPYCFDVIIIKKGLYFMGHQIRCSKCKKKFGKMLCPKCLKINPIKKNFFKTGKVRCGYSSCNQNSFLVNCIHCQRLNIFDEISPPIQGQRIICSYPDCQKIYNEVYCPSCDQLNPFPDGDFKFGKSYQCKNKICKKFFQYFLCSNCKNFSMVLDNKEGKKYICSKCNLIISNLGCPFCGKSILDKNSTLKYGQKIKCPNCFIIYSFIRCLECQKLIFSDEDKFLLGSAVKCKNCEKESTNVVCPKCNNKICFLGRNTNIEKGEKIQCTKCKEVFEFNNNENIQDVYFENLSTLDDISGGVLNFGKSKIDENFLSLSSLFINTDLYNEEEKMEIENIDKKSEYNKLCSICHSETKESIFFPCGHRTTCYKCAIFFFEVFKKCPKCDENGDNTPPEAIIPKIYY